MINVTFFIFDEIGIHKIYGSVDSRLVVEFCRRYYKDVVAIGGEVLEIFVDRMPCLKVFKKKGLLD